MKFRYLAALAAFLPTVIMAQPADELVGITRAIATAERQLSARAIEAELETRNGRLVYEVDLVRGTTLHRAAIDARSGKLVSAEKPRIENWVRGWVDRERLRSGSKAAPLAPRLAALERQSGGEVKDVELDMVKGRAIYEIELATAAGIGEVAIDALTGERLALASDD